jgi:hypothetical protein
MVMSKEELKASVYGEVYDNALNQMRMTEAALKDRLDVGFKSSIEAANFAHENHLDLLAISKTTNDFYYLTHRGERLKKKAWEEYYCKQILYTLDEKSNKHSWFPDRFEAHNTARTVGERPDGDREPLYHRDYFQPYGYFDPDRKTWNVAKPPLAFAKETGADTSHVIELLKHTAGECYLHLMAWLRHKMIYPTTKTELVPIFTSRAQGTGKTTFGEIICKGMFGRENVIVSEQYDITARFNSDSVDALVICMEEKDDSSSTKNTGGAIKSRVTGTEIRKENKNVDPYYQDSYTDYVITSNKDVPIKFEDSSDQRRFMVMESDEKFTRGNPMADEVFRLLYGGTIDEIAQGTPFTKDKNLISQFKHELFTNKELDGINMKDFPKTSAYNKCYSMPRNNESVEIESIMRSLAPIIQESLKQRKIVKEVTVPGGSTSKVSELLLSPFGITFVERHHGHPDLIAVCEPLCWFNSKTQEPFSHPTIERVVMDCAVWLRKEHGILFMANRAPLFGGFPGVAGRAAKAPALRFATEEDIETEELIGTVYSPNKGITFKKLDDAQRTEEKNRIGNRVRHNNKFQPDENGEYETVNELKKGMPKASCNVQYLDTFLFEADDTTKNNYIVEEARLKELTSEDVISASTLFKERLRAQMFEADRLFDDGIVARIVNSGGKSIHMLVRVKHQPRNVEEYKWLHAYLCNTISNTLVFDPVCNDPARLTRAPFSMVRHSEYKGHKVVGGQCLVKQDWSHVYNIDWRPIYEQWKNRPLKDYEMIKGKRMIPMKKEYTEAAKALLNGTFWSDATWNGRRQQCFFPAYRLCRLLGFSHDELWGDGGILDGIENYYRRDDINYWRSRIACTVIQEIDAELDKESEDDGNESY